MKNGGHIWSKEGRIRGMEDRFRGRRVGFEHWRLYEDCIKQVKNKVFR